jgi:hypothetical protein
MMADVTSSIVCMSSLCTTTLHERASGDSPGRAPPPESSCRPYAPATATAISCRQRPSAAHVPARLARTAGSIALAGSSSPPPSPPPGARGPCARHMPSGRHASSSPQSQQPPTPARW